MNLYSEVSRNVRKTWIILGLFIIFLSAIAYVYASASGYNTSLYLLFAATLSTIMSISSYYFSDKIVLATSGAKPVTKESHAELFNVLENLSIGSGIPMPKLYLIHDSSPNAFATGRDPEHAVVAVTTGLLEKLTRTELEGVLAHELSHIKNFDIRLMAVVAVIVGSIAFLADVYLRSMWSKGNRKGNGVLLLAGLVLSLLSPIIATIMQLAISRKREFLADASGALLTRYPDGLASALEKIAADKKPLDRANNATAHLYISNPFKNKSGTHLFTSLFNTHPPIEERIRILRSM
jgi:heat shock protein HtpX